MKILGIDTSTRFLSMGIYDDGAVYEYNLELNRRHSELLIVTMKRVLDALNWKPFDVDYFTCGLGPGSFTGLRIGIAAIKGFGFSLNKPIAGVSTLDIMAKNIDKPNFIVPAIDAKRGLIYSAVYDNRKDELKRISPYMLLSIGDFLKKIRPDSVVFGDALDLFKEKILKSAKGAVLLDKDYWYPQGRNIIHLALKQIRDKKLTDCFNIKPIYLYPKECQIKRADSV